VLVIPSSFARVGFYVAFSVVVSQRGGWVVGLCRIFCFFLGVVIAFAAYMYPSDVHILTTSFYRLLGFHRNFVLLYLVGGYLLFGSRQASPDDKSYFLRGVLFSNVLRFS
jgi:hypothetical protein